MDVIGVKKNTVENISQVTRPLFIPPSFVRPIIVTATGNSYGLVGVIVRRRDDRHVLASDQPTVSTSAVRVRVLMFHAYHFRPDSAVQRANVF